MVDLAAFPGLRYVDDDLRDVTAPPYDAIDSELQTALHDRHPHNVVRLELPLAEDRYARAAACYRRWLDEGVLARDAAPTVTVYRQTFAGGEQRGVIAAVRLEPWDAGVILPHERVFPGPVRDRLRLLGALPANTSPVYLLADAEPDVVRGALDDVVSTPPDRTFRDVEDGVDHAVWHVDAPDLVAALTVGYGDVAVLVADGHHRYTTALEFLVRHPRLGGAERLLAFVVGAGDGGPVIRPVHRLVRDLPRDALTLVRDAGFEVDAHDAPIRLVTGDGETGLRPTDDAARLVPDDVPDVVRTLDTAVLQALLLGPLRVADDPERLVYTPDEDAALAEVAGGRADGVFLVRPVELAQVRRVAQAGALMPPKTTSFFPKPRTGIVLRPLEG